MSYTYLLINLLTLAGPLAASFDKRLAFHRQWRFVLPAIAITAVIFIAWDMVFAQRGIWGFTPEYLLPLPRLGGLPVEEIFFFITIPYACLFLMGCAGLMKPHLPWLDGRFAAVMSALVAAAAIALLAAFPGGLYTVVVCLCTLALLGIAAWRRPLWLAEFYLGFLLSLVPFYIVNGLLTALPVVWYAGAGFSGLRVGTIPAEDHLYLFTLTLTNAFVLHLLKARVDAGSR